MDGKSDLGKRYFSDFPVYDGPGSEAKLVARVQGLSVQVGNTYQIFTIVFETERYMYICACDFNTFIHIYVVVKLFN